jgi:hypothetical protein
MENIPSCHTSFEESPPPTKSYTTRWKPFVLGHNNPALVAFSTIISEQGAPHQKCHLDKPHHGSHIMQYLSLDVRPQLYALLISLQETPTSMVATTAMCPGTERIIAPQFPTRRSSKQTICEDFGFAVQDYADKKEEEEEEGISSTTTTTTTTTMPWKAGDGLLYNGQVVRHRGSANDSGPTRAVLVLTFASRWDEASSRRILPLGPLFALRSDMWGFTWNDLKDPERFMKKDSWLWLRSYGLWKDEDAEWGWDGVRMTLLHRILPMTSIIWWNC